jgi:hypothetical protein
VSNIVNFADHTQPNSSPQARARKAEDLRALGKAGHKPTATDRERIAENLFRLLARLETDKGGRRATLCRTVLHSPDHESTKRLRNFELDPEKEGEARQKQINTLYKKLTKYIDLAEAAARDASEDVDAVLLNLVHGTSLVRAGSAPPEDAMTKNLKEQLIRHLDRAASKVAIETGLQRTFQLIARYPGRASDRYGNVVAGPINDTLLCLEDGNTSPPPGTDDHAWWRIVQSAPSVLIGEAIIDRVNEEPQVASYPSFRFGKARQSLIKKEAKLCEDEHWSAVTEYRVQVWLAVLPFGPSHEPRLGIRLELLRHVQITRLQQTHEQLERRAPEVVFSGRIFDLKRSAKWESDKDDLQVMVPVNLAPLAPHLNLLLGRELYQNEVNPARVLAFGSEEAQRALDFPDCGTISNWVGPRPEVVYSGGIRLDPEPDFDDYARWQDWQQARQEADDRNRTHRFRFGRFEQETEDERYPMSWKAGTLGYKLERSLLEIDGDSGVIQQLRAQAENLTDEVRIKIDAALSARDERLVRLHYTYAKESDGGSV